MKKEKDNEPTKEEIEEFLKESNAIEQEYSQEAYRDALQAWTTGVLNARDDFSVSLMLGIHRRVLKRLAPKIAGKIRTVPVYVGNSTSYRECLKPKLIRKELDKLFNDWNENKEKIKKMSDNKKEAFVKQWHIYFEGVHPHIDGNGRVGRILMNLQRLMLGLPILIIYDKEKGDYYQWFKE